MRRHIPIALLLILAINTIAAVNPFSLLANREDARNHVHKEQARAAVADSVSVPTERMSDVACVDGMAGPFPCDGVDLLGFVPLDEFRGSEALAPLGGGTSDIWGWTDPDNGDEYVILGKTNGTAFFRVTDPTNPTYLGEIANTSPAQLIWHDIKVFDNHAFIVSESAAHGMRVFDMTRLRGVTEARTWTEDVNYPLGFSAHNIAINEDTGFAYLVGGNNGLVAPDHCRSGLHIVDINDPKAPVFAGCHAIGEGNGTGGGIVGVPVASYIHDTQCVLYDGPDADYTDREICLNSSEIHLSVVDVTNKALPTQISTVEYPQTDYTHQGWFTEDKRYFLLGDEGDETRHKTNTRTMIFDVSDLDNPVFVGAHEADTKSIDHNLYIKNGLVYQSNYTAGLRITDTHRLAEGVLTERAFFDSFPANDDATFHGTWSNYPYFASGTIAFSGIDEGLFLVKVHDDVLSAYEHTDGEDPADDVRGLPDAASDKAKAHGKNKPPKR